MDSGRSTAQDHLRVLQVTPRYAPSVGGVETHVREVARRLPARNVETAVLTPDPSGSLPAHEVLDGVTVHRVDARPRGRDYMFAPGLCGAIRDGGWDLVHVQSYHTLVAPIAMAAAARARIPYVLTFHAGSHSSLPDAGPRTPAEGAPAAPHARGGPGGDRRVRGRALRALSVSRAGSSS